MDLVQKRKQLRQRQVDKVKKFRQSNMSASAAVQKQKERDEMKKEIRKEIEKETQKESMNIENSDGTTFARVMNIIGPAHMRPLVSNGVWKGTEQISEKKTDCECDDCGQDPCIECGESHHSVKESISKNYGSQTAREGDNEAAAAARKRIYDRASAQDKDHMDAVEIANQRNQKRHGKVVVTKEAKVEANRSDYGKASVRNKRKFGKEGEPAIFDTNSERGKMIDQRRAEHKAKRGVKEDYYSGTGEKVVARTKKYMDKKGMKGAPGLDVMKARTADHKEKRGVKTKMESYDWRSDDSMRINKIFEGKKKGLWDNIHAKRKRGEKPAKPGDKDYPKTLDVDEGLKQARKNVGADTCWDGYTAKGTKKKGGKEVPNCVKENGVSEGAAWTKKSGKSASGGLNEKGRKSYERENPGSDLKAPQPEGGSRKKSFCARMGGMKKKLTSSKTANDPDSRINKALRKWKC